MNTEPALLSSAAHPTCPPACFPAPEVEGEMHAVMPALSLVPTLGPTSGSTIARKVISIRSPGAGCTPLHLQSTPFYLVILVLPQVSADSNSTSCHLSPTVPFLG